MRLLAIALILSPLWAIGAGEAASTEAEIEKLCRDLGADAYETRETAHRTLLSLGKQVKEPLRTLQQTSEDAEVLWRSAAILREIAEREMQEDLFGDPEAVFSEQELTDAKALAERLEDGGVQHRNKVYEDIGPDKLPRMVETMRAWMRSHPTDGNVAYNLGYTLFWLERYREAAAVWHCTETIAPQESRAFNDAGIALERDGRYEEAVAQYEKTMQHFPHFSHPYTDLASLKATLGDHKEALRLHQASFRLQTYGDPGSSSEGVLAMYLAFNGELEEAEKHFETAFAEKSERIYAFGNRFDVLHIHGRFEEMKKVAEDAAREFPDHSEVLLMQAVLARATGNRDDAMKTIEQLIAQRGETDSLKRRKASYLLSAGHHEEAGAIIRPLLERNPRDPDMLATATSWARATKRWREAVEFAIARTRLLPNVPDAHADLAAIYAMSEDPKVRNLDRARDLVKVVDRLMAHSYYYGTARLNRAELDAELSYVFEADGNPTEALTRYRALAEFYPWNKTYQDRLAKLTAAAREAGTPPAP